MSLTSIRDPAVLGAMLPDGCAVCGGREFAYSDVLWEGLIDEWQLNPDEAHYINIQQGLACRACGANLRSIVLAAAICDAMNHQGTLSGWIASAAGQTMALLEINEAGGLTPWLRKAPGHLLVNYPDADMHALPFHANSFDLVLHSDTLEHVENPVHALSECRRVLRAGGVLALTVPTIVGRMTRSRAGLPPSFHGSAGSNGYIVRTEFGADFWTLLPTSGFHAVTIHSGIFPAGLALTARK